MKRALGFIIAFLILASLALTRDGRFFGHAPGAGPAASTATEQALAPDHYVINTTEIGRGIIGYAGPVPLEVFVTGDRVDSVRALPNSESPDFFGSLETAGLTRAWDGMTLAEAAEAPVDGVSGATYSSRAFIANVRAAAAYAIDEAAAPGTDFGFSWKLAAALAVIAAGALIPLFHRGKRYRVAQQLLNAGVLGFWGGTFVDYAMMTGFLANGALLTMGALVTVALLVVALVYPLFGKPGHYCAWMCPFGSLQDLAGHLRSRKLHISPALARGLDTFRQALWVALLLMLYTGIGAAWIDYEIFTGFIVEAASWIVLAAGGAFVLLSVFVPRPFCRFVCPTGSLLKII